MTADPKTSSEARTDRVAESLRAVVLVVLLGGMIGMGVELYFMNHFEDVWMAIPLVLIGLSLLVLLMHALARSKVTIRLFRLSMLLMIVGGAVGTLWHHQAKEEFTLEGQPSLKGMQLFWQAMRGTTPPSLAPAALIQTGLLGLAWTYRHPRVMRQQ